MQFFLSLFLISVAVQVSVAPPVTQNKKDGEHEDKEVVTEEDREVSMEYRRYLTEVVEALESDPDFRAKLKKADEADIRTGRIAEQLQFVNHNVRSLLDELKRNELERLKHLATKENELRNGLDVDHLKIAEHLDHTNTRTFEIQDLKKLIIKTTKDLAEADARRREEFKQYEMEKKYEEQQKLQGMNDNDRKKYEEELQAMKEKHKKHEPVHHPGSKQQLEEVWEKQDHMETDDFNPRTFFFLHDVDGNSVWDQDEVKALFLKELDKLYAQGATEEDMLKRTEEMERMREHVFNEADLNKDGLISLDEFLEQTRKPDFQQDEGWEGLDEQQIYTPEEFEDFEKHRNQISRGMPPPHADNIPNYNDQFPPQYVNIPVPEGHHQQFQGDIHQQQYQPQQVPMQQQFTNNQPMHGSQQQHYQPQIPQNQQQVPVQQQQYQQQQQPQHGQVPQQQQQGQPPVQHQQYQQQPQHGQVQMQQQQQPQHGQVQMQQQQQPQHGQVQMQQQQNPPNVQQQAHQQNTANSNQVPHNVPGNAAAAVPPAAVPQNIQTQTQQKNVQGGQAAAQPPIHRNEIHAGGKA